jgi:hypothetical protein
VKVSNVRAAEAAPVQAAASAPVFSDAPAQPVEPKNNGVTVHDAKTATVRDKNGRTIKVKKLGALDRVRLFKALGAEASENRQVMHYSALAASVTELNGDHVGFPTTSAQVDALIARLDDDGLEAVITALVALSPEMAEGAVDQAKNS